ncbi:MAG: glycosyltransferase [Ignavibacteria bacterium]|nr:glycosyltransferase [Ignavibacteria bacterium]
MKALAPICLFVYNRPWHTAQTIESLKKNILASDSDLYIFSDGSKKDNTSNSISEVRSYIETITGFKSVNIILREKNLGLAQNIIAGVSEVINIHGKIIVLEDDIITHPKFLKYMNDSLDLYKNDENVASIHGYVYPIEGLPETFFIKGADCWGWATWARAWSVFEPNGAKLLNEIKQKKAEKEINYNKSMNYVRMLKNQINGNNDSWAVRWHISAFLKNMLTLYPGKSFVTNIGFDSSGQHCATSDVYDPILCDNYYELKKIELVEDKNVTKLFEDYFNKTNKTKLNKGINYFINLLRKR